MAVYYRRFGKNYWSQIHYLTLDGGTIGSLGAESLKLLAPQLFQKFPQFYENRRSITVFTKADHLSLLSKMNPVNGFTFYIF